MDITELSDNRLIALHQSQMDIDEDMARACGIELDFTWRDLDDELNHRVETTNLEWPYEY